MVEVVGTAYVYRPRSKGCGDAGSLSDFGGERLQRAQTWPDATAGQL